VFVGRDRQIGNVLMVDCLAGGSDKARVRHERLPFAVIAHQQATVFTIGKQRPRIVTSGKSVAALVGTAGRKIGKGAFDTRKTARPCIVRPQTAAEIDAVQRAALAQQREPIIVCQIGRPDKRTRLPRRIGPEVGCQTVIGKWLDRLGIKPAEPRLPACKKHPEDNQSDGNKPEQRQQDCVQPSAQGHQPLDCTPLGFHSVKSAVTPPRKHA
jgi:hypothetical protein